MSGLLRTPVTRLAAVLAFAYTVALLPATASAQSFSDLGAAQQKVNDLEAKIEGEQTSVRSLQGELRALAANVGREQNDLDQIRSDLTQTTAQITDIRAHLDRLRTEIKMRARTAYKQGPLQLFSILVGAQTLNQFVERAAYASRIAQRDQHIVLEARVTEGKLRTIQAQQASLEHEQSTKVHVLRSRQDALTDTFARQQAVLAQLAHSRAEAIQLVATLATKLGAGLAGLRRVAGQGMTISYGEWAAALLVGINASTSRNNLVAVVAWEASEGTDATWNPLATTFDEPGASTYNSSGVKNYISKGQGIDATVGTLNVGGHGYAPILANLRGGAPSMDSARAINRSDWCSGCAGGSYVTGYIPAVERYYDRYAG
jgi:peptidoglycan hydrolase CwlO-like protein